MLEGTGDDTGHNVARVSVAAHGRYVFGGDFVNAARVVAGFDQADFDREPITKRCPQCGYALEEVLVFRQHADQDRNGRNAALPGQLFRAQLEAGPRLKSSLSTAGHFSVITRPIRAETGCSGKRT